MFNVQILWTLCLIPLWTVHKTSAVSETPSETEPVCASCAKHDQLMASLASMKQSAQSLGHRLAKVGTTIDDLEDCSCLHK